MSYDKGKTIKEYMGGGYAQPMKYQTGGYIPGISRALYGANLNRRVGIAQDEQRQQAKALEKQEKRRGLFGKLGSLGGTIAGGVLATALAPVTGGASLLAGAALAKGLGSAGGSFLGEKLAEGTTDTSRVGRQSSTGLLDSGFEELGDIKREASKGILGRSLATGVKTGLMAGGADYLKGFGDKIFANRVTKQGLLDNPYLSTMSDADDAWAAGADYFGSEGLTQFQNINQGGKVYGYEDGGEAMNFKKGYFDRDFPKDSFKAMIKEAVDRGEIDPREGLQHILNKQQKDFMKSQDDTSNVLYKQLEKSGYAGGGLINMLPFNRRIM
jgi:hypothetical protein